MLFHINVVMRSRATSTPAYGLLSAASGIVHARMASVVIAGENRCPKRSGMTTGAAKLSASATGRLKAASVRTARRTSAGARLASAAEDGATDEDAHSDRTP